MSFLRRAQLATVRVGPMLGTFFVFGGTISAYLIAKYCGWDYKQYKLNRECGYAEELFRKQLQKEQDIGEADYTLRSM